MYASMLMFLNYELQKQRISLLKTENNDKKNG